ncbi:unnamed protein product, partial [Amoebophrya sp. A120]|eukprot:GSA120T00015216001.1
MVRTRSCGDREARQHQCPSSAVAEVGFKETASGSKKLDEDALRWRTRSLFSLLTAGAVPSDDIRHLRRFSQLLTSSWSGPRGPPADQE